MSLCAEHRKAVEAYKRDKSIQPTFAPLGAIVYDERVMSFKGLLNVERRFHKNVNHVISKRIVQKAKTHRKGIAIEDLRHICKRTA